MQPCRQLGNQMVFSWLLLGQKRFEPIASQVCQRFDTLLESRDRTKRKKHTKGRVVVVVVAQGNDAHKTESL